jgi:ubiquinone biosynthesis monooxygenase Coq7
MSSTPARSASRSTARRRLPGDLKPRDLLARMLRVDHAGEFGAQRIYSGQIAKLQKSAKRPLLEHMARQEQEHLEAFEQELRQRHVRPTLLHPLWKLAGYALGAGTALLGERAAMACTVAVETVIDSHYQQQLDLLGEDEAPLKARIEKFQAEELEHRDIGLENEAELTPAYELLSALVRTSTRAVIWVAERV